MEKFNTHGGYFAPAGYQKVNEGGSHEENPYGGVQLGVDRNDIPNLLEEGEPVYDDYVYSDNIKADVEMLKKHKLPEKYSGKLFSEIADRFLEEAEERPQDPISNNGLEAMLGRLANAQEEQKQLKEQADLEAELANLSPEELATLEAMLSQEQESAQNGIQYADGGGKDGRTAEEEMACRNSEGIASVGSVHLGEMPGMQASDNKYGFIISPNGGVGKDINTVEQNRMNRTAQTRNNAVSIFDQYDTEDNSLPTWPRYAGAITSALTGLHNVFQEPDHYSIPAYTPIVPEARIHLVDPRYNPIDVNLAVNDIMAQSAGTARTIRNSGLGPSTGATLLAHDYNTTRNLGAARTQVVDANEQRRNAVLAGINQNESARAQFDLGVSQARANILNDAMVRNAQNSLLLQRLNNAAEAEKYAAVSNQFDQVGQALSDIGRENVYRNMANSPYDYYVDAKGNVHFKSPKDTLLKKVKR